jgi:hypothetical protein
MGTSFLLCGKVEELHLLLGANWRGLTVDGSEVPRAPVVSQFIMGNWTGLPNTG